MAMERHELKLGRGSAFVKSRLKRLRQLHAQVASADAAFLQQLSDHAFDEIDGNTEGHAAVAAAVRGDGGVDADDIAVHVDERPTA